jgi:hypothetical protein
MALAAMGLCSCHRKTCKAKESSDAKQVLLRLILANRCVRDNVEWEVESATEWRSSSRKASRNAFTFYCFRPS